MEVCWDYLRLRSFKRSKDFPLHIKKLILALLGKKLILSTFFSGRERWIVKIRDFRQRWLFWSMGLQIQDSGLLFGVQCGRSSLHGQSPKWFWTLVCPSGGAASSQFTFYRSQKIRTFVWCSGIYYLRILFIIYNTGCLMANFIFVVQCNTDTLICTAKAQRLYGPKSQKL